MSMQKETRESSAMFAYLDNAATTRVWPQAAQAALEEMTAGFGNPSARCAFG